MSPSLTARPPVLQVADADHPDRQPARLVGVPVHIAVGRHPVVALD